MEPRVVGRVHGLAAWRALGVLPAAVGLLPASGWPARPRPWPAAAAYGLAAAVFALMTAHVVANARSTAGFGTFKVRSRW